MIYNTLPTSLPLRTFWTRRTNHHVRACPALVQLLSALKSTMSTMSKPFQRVLPPTPRGPDRPNLPVPGRSLASVTFRSYCHPTGEAGGDGLFRTVNYPSPRQLRRAYVDIQQERADSCRRSTGAEGVVRERRERRESDARLQSISPSHRGAIGAAGSGTRGSLRKTQRPLWLTRAAARH